ncbi:MAG: tyrosine-type recombinase/integrase [Nitrosopumilus sp.]|nr:tyrosine-type recombinase/integrase [Nitrosopumilus sp.]
MDKIPRCLVLFETACKSVRTFKTYKFGLDKFLDWCHKDYESLLMLPAKELEDILQDYCIFLRTRVNSKEISPNSIPTYFNPIWRFLKVNRVKVDKESVIQLYPDKVKLGGHDAITTEQLVKLLNATDTLRDRAIVHFFSATGARPEAVCELQLKHIAEYEDNFYKVVLYSEDYKHEMITFLHTEAVKSLKEYFVERESHGEKLTSESFVFAVNGYWKLESKPMSYNVLENMFDRLWKRSGIVRVKIGNRYNLASTTSIRKRFDTILEMNPEVSSGASQYLMDHTGYLSGTHYRRPTEAQIFTSYHAVSSELMISNELRMKLQLKQKEEEIQKNESNKDSKIRELEKRLENTDKLLRIVLSKLES